MKKTFKQYPDFAFEDAVSSENQYVCGVDEAGRGPIAGPVVAAAVILPRDFDLAIGINDSKKITETKRFKLAQVIKQKAVAWAIAYADVDKIEEINILQASVWAMKQAIQALSPQPDFLLIDGNYFPNTPIPAKTIVSGDAKSISIAAASILAKTERDQYMIDASKKYPAYSFHTHKGYGTKTHYAAIDEYGTSPLHRPSFLVKYYAKKAQLELFSK